ncbi:CDP-glycerol glycerophosphotransferase (TagB/SpsB family) [Leucobacter luti]|uniref:CDP-glycerol glycerophosphotransferase family protein n=1 Tax=Leucobacter luti TaxID=340320 RepID=UPI00104A3319|nr:CDP-glycerol glycerophosphotransferase family protein [Leucobacter luti]MCW2289853.1 glycosyltransferase involved in cell wall biosynthesis/CDP-glycerol glycerophosphotransferase (TagB/SpsB family)/tetratricopeptide (TPR) repeat protein [Leucobacter luti]TCK36022.1 CDP-glycerol glycerophosphotransferase (TagB/SpsB family) [Leucobacter luti]
MSTTRKLRHAAAQAAAVMFDFERPWRKSFLVLRAAQSPRFSGRLGGIPATLERRFEASFTRHPGAISPYFQYVMEHESRTVAVERAHKYAQRADISAPELVEIAKFFYSVSRFALGDECIERAKTLDSTLLRIYDEEAWNHRARGNLHREIAAVRSAIELAPNALIRLEWEMWLGEALLRRQDVAGAWEHLQRWSELPGGSNSVLSAAYAAVLLGNISEADAAYQHALGSPPEKSYCRLAAARMQLEEYGRSEESLRLLDSGGMDGSAAAHELAYRAHVRLGNVAKSLTELEAAAKLPDRSESTQGILAQLLTLHGDLPAALKQYEALTPQENTDTLRVLHGELLAGKNDPRAATRVVLASPETPSIREAKHFALEIDPRVHELRREAIDCSDVSVRADLLTELLGRLSEPEALAAAAASLALALSELDRWDEAWLAARQVSGQRLPSVSFSTEQSNIHTFTHNMEYAEWSEAEAIRRGVILYEASLGDATSCNPLAICLHLLDAPGREDLIHVWSITDQAVISPALLGRTNVRFVRKGSTGHIRHLATAQYLVTNATWDYVFTKRPGQRALNTWHGVPWKTLGRDQRSEPLGYGNVARSLLQADLILAPDAHTSDVLTRGMAIDGFLPSGVLVRSGYPRNDLSVALAPSRRAAIRTALGVPEDGRLALYMPTWKGLFGERDAEVDDTLATARALGAPGLTVGIRAHHYVRSAFAEAAAPPGVRFIPEEFDTNELLGAADVLVTDFSSVLFDASATGLPVVTLVSGLDHYASQRGLYFSPEEVPGRPAATMTEAAAAIQDALTDPATFISSYAAQTSRFSTVEDGRSSERVVRMFLDQEGIAEASVALPPPPENLYFATGGLPPNGITRAARSLLAALDGTGIRPMLPLTQNMLETASSDTTEDVLRFSTVLPAVGEAAGTAMESSVMSFYRSRYFRPSSLIDRHLQSGQRREARRRYGSTEFAGAVEYSAYDSTSVALVAHGIQITNGGARGVVLHSEMWEEITQRFPRLGAGMTQLGFFDFIGSVSEGVRESNAIALHREYGVPLESHITLENTINAEEILAGGRVPLEETDSDWYSRSGSHIVLVGRLSPEKNYRQFFRALAATAHELRSPVWVSVLGDGPLRLGLQHYVLDLGLSKHVRFRGMVANPYAHIRAADALMLPSRHEGQPLVVLEALTLGTPVVATDIPGSRSVLRDGALGRLVPRTRRGISEGIRLVVDGDLVPPGAFDAEQFTRESVHAFLAALHLLPSPSAQS